MIHFAICRVQSAGPAALPRGLALGFVVRCKSLDCFNIVKANIGKYGQSGGGGD